MTASREVTFGIKTSPMHTSYQAILRTWQQADEVSEIQHAWLWDHMLPLTGPKDGPIFEGWTLLAALAAQTRRLRLGLLVTNNQIRQPAVLGKIASTLDVISGGRLVLGLGVGGTLPAEHSADSRPAPWARRVSRVRASGDDSRAGHRPTLGGNHDSPAHVYGDAFDFDGRYYTLTGTRNEPKPVQRPGPPVLVGGTGTRLLRLVAEQADIWNIPGPPHASLDFVTERSRVLDQHCADIGRDPAEITRSVQLVITASDPAGIRATIAGLIGAGFSHIVLGVRPPAPDNVPCWLAEEIIRPVSAEIASAAS